MGAQYLVPCECGEAMRVDRGQAGQSLACRCGKTILLPTLRQMEQLPRVDTDGEAASRDASWTRGQGALFVIGVFVLTLALVSGGYTLAQRLRLDPTVSPLDRFLAQDDLGRLSTEDALVVWQAYQELGLQWGHSPQYLVQRQRRNLLNVYLGLAAGGIVLGVVVTWAAFRQADQGQSKRAG